MGRKKFYDSVEEMQKDLDAYLRIYNTRRSHQGRNMNGRTPEAVFKSGPAQTEKIKGGNRQKSRVNYPPSGAATVSQLPYLYITEPAQ